MQKGNIKVWGSVRQEIFVSPITVLETLLETIIDKDEWIATSIDGNHVVYYSSRGCDVASNRILTDKEYALYCSIKQTLRLLKEKDNVEI